MSWHNPTGISVLPPLAFSPGLITDVLSSSSPTTTITQKNSFVVPSTTRSAESIVVTNQQTQQKASYYNAMTQALHNLNEKKRLVTETYLHLIEDTVDNFLSSPAVGVHLKAISDRYLDEPPTNMALIRRNADLLANLTQDSFNPHSELNQHLVAPLVHKVYVEFLDPLRQDLYNFWCGGGTMSASNFLQTEEPLFKNNNNSNLDDLSKMLKKLITKCHGVYQDMEHINQMRELDAHSTAEIAEKFKGGGLSHVVPIAGLALGRIHRLLNEHNTVIQHWGSSRRRVEGRNGDGYDADQLNTFSPPPAVMRRQF